MKKKQVKNTEETKLNDDVAAFEEWEEGAKAEDELEDAEKFEELGEEADELEEELKEFEELEREEPPDTERTKLKIKADEPELPAAIASNSLTDDLMDLSPDVPVNLVAVIGKTTINVGELVRYRVGQVVDLNRPPSETVDVVANGRLIAKGELVEMDGKLGVKIIKMVR